jgi:hypothetical protein
MGIKNKGAGVGDLEVIMERKQALGSDKWRSVCKARILGISLLSVTMTKYVPI